MASRKPSRLSNSYTGGAEDEFEDDEQRHRFQASLIKSNLSKGADGAAGVGEDDDDDDDGGDDQEDEFQIPLSNEITLKGPTKVRFRPL